MKKYYTLLLMLILIISLSFSILAHHEGELEEKTEVDVEIEDEEDSPVKDIRRISATPILRRDVIRLREKLLSLSEFDKKKLESLKEHNLRKIHELDEADLRKVVSLTEEELKKLSHLDRARLKEFSDLNIDQLKMRLKRIRLQKIRVDHIGKLREIDFENRSEALKRHREAKNELKNLKGELKDIRASYLDAIKAGDNETAFEHAKNYLLKSVDALISSLEKVKERVNAAETVSEEEAAELIGKIDSDIKKLEEIKVDIEEAETREELKDAAKDLREIWKKIRHRKIAHVYKVIHAKIGRIIKRAELLERKLECTLENMEERGIDVTDLNSKLDSFSSKINEARENYKEAIDIFRDIKSASRHDLDIREDANKAKSLMREAHELLKESHRILKDIRKEIKEKGGNIRSCVDPGLLTNEDIEVIEEDEDD